MSHELGREGGRGGGGCHMSLIADFKMHKMQPRDPTSGEGGGGRQEGGYQRGLTKAR